MGASQRIFPLGRHNAHAWVQMYCEVNGAYASRCLLEKAPSKTLDLILYLPILHSFS